MPENCPNTYRTPSVQHRCMNARGHYGLCWDGVDTWWASAAHEENVRVAAELDRLIADLTCTRSDGLRYIRAVDIERRAAELRGDDRA